MIIEYSGIQPTSDVMNLFDLGSPSLFEAGNGPGHCLVLTFPRIAIRPTALAVRSGPCSRTARLLSSCVFQGWDAKRQTWVVLDERRSVVELVPGAPTRVAHIDTDREFSKFRLLHTDRNMPWTAHFSLGAFDIHGKVRVLDETTTAPIEEADGFDGFDPWSVGDWE
jgi:hypothetical protein